MFCNLRPVLGLGGNLILSAAMMIALSGVLAAQTPGTGSDEKTLDVQTSSGGLHVGTDGNASKAGVPLYPGARPKKEDHNNNALNFGLFTEALGVKLVVAKYSSEDAPERIIAFYREKLKRYGHVLECHTHEHGGDVRADNDDKDDTDDAKLKCEGDNTGPVTELKVGTSMNQHVVAIEPGEQDKGSSFAIVYVHARKESDI
ncbi:MAG TPA: hypothetical protein VFO39_14580 [Candidatus Sulfotelmatobacter sp.]|nr:hypothetical protein [Candidatus Sulfotelmatobacter sp.]